MLFCVPDLATATLAGFFGWKRAGGDEAGAARMELWGRALLVPREGSPGTGHPPGGVPVVCCLGEEGGSAQRPNPEPPVALPTLIPLCGCWGARPGPKISSEQPEWRPERGRGGGG